MAATARALNVGKLEDSPLTDLLVSLVEQRATGTLVLQERGGRKSAVYFYLGAAVKAHTPALLTAHSSGTEAVAQHLEWAAALSGTTAYGFYPGIDYLYRVRPAPTNPLALIWRIAKRTVNPNRVNQVVTGLGERPLRLHLRADLGRFYLSWDEMAALALLRSGRNSFNDLLATFDGDLAMLCKLVYVLVLCRHIEMPGQGEPVGVEGPEIIVAPRVPPAGSIPGTPSAASPYHSSQPPPRAVSGMKRQVRANAGAPYAKRLRPSHPPSPSLSALNAERLLDSSATGVPPRTAASTVGGPSSGPSNGLYSGGTSSDRVNARPLESPQPRSGAEYRVKSSTSPTSSAGTPQAERAPFGSSVPATPRRHSLPETAESHEVPRDSALALRNTTDCWARAERYSRSGDYAKALDLVRDRYRPEWNNTDRGAFVAYLKARCGVLGTDEGIQMLEACSRAVMECPDESKFRFYRGWVYRSLGRENAALMDFVEVARDDPTNVDAAREVHLARKRRMTTSSTPSLMGRLKRSLTPTPPSHREVVIPSRPGARPKPK